MIKYKNTRIILCKWLPKNAEAITLRWFILFKKSRYEECNKPDAGERDKLYFSSIMNHELKHVEQQKKYTIIGFAFLYFFFPKYRLKFELEGYIYNYLFYLSFGMTQRMACGVIAGMLSSVTYFNMLTYDEAFKICEQEYVVK